MNTKKIHSSKNRLKKESVQKRV
ncbi:hypothetical protein A5845_002321, partial [Enterococcus faecium]